MPIDRPKITRLRDNRDFEFISIERQGRTSVGLTLQPLLRPGANTTALLKRGRSACPYVLRCRRDYASRLAADDAIDDLTDLLKGELVSATMIGGKVIGKLAVLDVVESGGGSTPLVLSVGGFESNAKATIAIDLIVLPYARPPAV